MGFLAAHPLQAQNVMELMPAGWKLEEHDKSYGGRSFLAPDGISAAKIDHYKNVKDLADSADKGRYQIKPTSGTTDLRSSNPTLLSGTNAYVAAGAWQDDDTGVRTMGIALATVHKSGGHMVCSYRTRMANQMPPEMMQWIKTCLAYADRGGFVYDQDVRTAAARAKIAAVPLATGKGRAIEGTFLSVYYISGVGGMILPDYMPVILYKDGTAIRRFEAPPSEIDVAEFVRQQPDDVTRWKKTAKGYSVHWPDESSADEIESDSERPKTFPANHRLNGYWKRLSGGGNSAFGGDMTIGISNGYKFLPDGRFSTDSSASGSSPGVFAGSTGKDGGTYSLNGNMLVLRYNNGQEKRLGVYYGGKLDDPVLWIAGDSFTN